jgi:NAD(P)-dependent dehydrogenase (short-subunit alcohol dehydrogenase family)
MTIDLSGKAALVTGGGSGIGLGCAQQLLAAGASVTLMGRTLTRLEEAAATLAPHTTPAAVVRVSPGDVLDEDAVARAVAVASEATGGLDACVAAAGGSDWLGPITATPLDAWRRVVDVNLTGTFLTLKHAGRAMARAGGGSFVAISSIAAARSHRWMAPYCSAKLGIDMLVEVAADELGGSGVRVNSVRPGLVDTELVGAITAGGPVLDDYLAQMPVARVGTVDDIAACVLWLVGATWVTGQHIAVDGGHSIRRGPDFGAYVTMVYDEETLAGRA